MNETKQGCSDELCPIHGRKYGTVKAECPLDQSHSEESWENEVPVFWEEIAKHLPRNYAREALGDEAIFLSFKMAYPKIREFLLSLRDKELVERLEGMRKIPFGKDNYGTELYVSGNDMKYNEILDQVISIISNKR